MSNLPVKYIANNIEYDINTESVDQFTEQKFVPEPVVDFCVHRFTLANRHWQSYSVDKIEIMLRYANVIQDGWYYRTFVETNGVGCLIFQHRTL